MTLVARRFSTGIMGMLVVSASFGLAACSSSEPSADAPDQSANVSQEAPGEAVDILQDTLAGEQSQRLLDLLNAEDDTTAEDLEEHLHATFTDEVSVEELVDLFNENLRPAQPFTPTDYEGGDREAVTTLTSEVSDPLDMSLSVDPDGLITGLFFGPSDSDG